MLKGNFQPGDMIVIDEANGELVFERHQDATTDYLELNQNHYVEEDMEQE